MLLTVLSLNLQLGGILPLDGEEPPRDRWPGLAALIRDSGAHIVLLQETAGWTDHNRSHAIRAIAELGLALPPDALSPTSSASLMYAPDALELTQWETRYTDPTSTHGFAGIGVFNVPGSPRPIAVSSAHLSPVSAPAAADRAAHLAWRVRRYGDVGIIGGDINHHPLPRPGQGPVVAPATLPAANVVGRWRGPAGDLRPDYTVAEVFDRGRFTDVAAHMAALRGDPALLGPTAPGGVRCDQIHVTEPLVPALAGYEVRPAKDSDHDALLLTLDTAAIDPALVHVEHV
ncbi:hypothetical protein CLV63_11298 [Murinocardiopsis flavida]|uniref:Endonuclease/exonuclease/phosphatase family metal-dependent hydrolase n=1 Tax=Murinocardiopsis flavida TaxID=645275 RepID=A0A2P8DG93_9ACTN|nr:hypothetical protein [Murinocardiopsis flavida]PSK96216.1 hypothetical protein CLV63_11298 [Murinocardiopsis flavida]